MCVRAAESVAATVSRLSDVPIHTGRGSVCLVPLPVEPLFRSGSSGGQPNGRDGRTRAIHAQMDLCLAHCRGAQLLVFNLASNFAYHIAEVRGCRTGAAPPRVCSLTCAWSAATRHAQVLGAPCMVATPSVAPPSDAASRFLRQVLDKYVPAKVHARTRHRGVAVLGVGHGLTACGGGLIRRVPSLSMHLGQAEDGGGSERRVGLRDAEHWMAPLFQVRVLGLCVPSPAPVPVRRLR